MFVFQQDYEIFSLPHLTLLLLNDVAIKGPSESPFPAKPLTLPTSMIVRYWKYIARICAATTFYQRWRRGPNLRGQGQEPRCRGQAASRPRTERLEAKAKDSRTRLKISANINVNIVIMISQAFKR